MRILLKRTLRPININYEHFIIFCIFTLMSDIPFCLCHSPAVTPPHTHTHEALYSIQYTPTAKCTILVYVYHIAPSHI
jgi:hypothetical protein